MGREEPGGVLLLDKPEGWSSTRALARARRLLDARKAGHTGTLDPFATGLLPLAFGEATKFSRFLLDATKSYEARLRLGVESSTGDPEGVLSPAVPVDASDDAIDAVLARFVGVGSQIPPMHSAVHVGGRRLYEIAREGREVAREPRAIEILALSRLAREGDEVTVAVVCSKGTYVRTLAADIGRALGCGAYLTALRRTAVGPFRLEQAVTLESLEAAGVAGARARLLPLEVLVAGLPRLDAAAGAARRFAHGQAIECPAAGEGGEWAVFGDSGDFLGVGRMASPGRLAPLRLLSPAGGEAP